MKIKLDTTLAVVLIAYFILHYGIFPRLTPYPLFAFIFLILILFGVLDTVSIKRTTYERFKNVALWVLIIVTIVSAFATEIILRHESLPTFRVHDILIQQEYAIKFLLSGQNPYDTTYFGTPLEDWFYSGSAKNPALYHFVMQPFYMIFALPFYVVSGKLFGFFDGRIPLLFLFLSVLFFIQKLKIESARKRVFLILLGFNPLTLPYALEGRSDFFMFAHLFAGFYFLQVGKNYLSAIFIAFAFAVKQSAWPILPLWIAYLWFKNKEKKRLVAILGIFVIVFVGIIFPFLLWNPVAFIESTILYLSGNTLHSYPINGYGFGMLLNQIEIIKNLNDKFPFIIFQFITSLPLLIVLIRQLKKTFLSKV